MTASGDLRSRLREALKGRPWTRRRVRFLLGTDELIANETRVALTPTHLGNLRDDLAAAGLELEAFALRGAGLRAGFDDDDYALAGATLVGRSQAGEIEGIDVVHALKEPTDWESEVPGPFLRIGALHLASYPHGVCRMLARRNFAAILDGGTVGSCSYLLHGGDRTPIVASMSRFAGSVSGVKLVAGLDAGGIDGGRILVVGGGVAGLAAIEKLLPKCRHLVVVEHHAPARERLPATLRALGVESFEIATEIGDRLHDAVGLVFAHRSGAKAAEKVCTIEQVRTMRRGAAIADIAIDQGGSILHDGTDEHDDAATALRKYRVLLKDFVYYAETNMPREVPHEASIFHGDASGPYVTLLLALCALHGGPRAAAGELLSRPVQRFTDRAALGERGIWDCLLQDLRNGVQLAAGHGAATITDPEMERIEALARWVARCGSSPVV